MHNIERGIIKWMPFNSVISSKEVVNSILKEKSKIKMPILSEEQIINIEKILILAFYSNVKINVFYYRNGTIENISGYIKKIDPTYRKIYFENKTILFNQIIKVI